MRNTETKIYRIYVHTYAFLHCAQTMSGLNKRDKDKSIKENKYTNGLYYIIWKKRVLSKHVKLGFSLNKKTC